MSKSRSNLGGVKPLKRTQNHQKAVMERRSSGATDWATTPRGGRTRADSERRAVEEWDEGDSYDEYGRRIDPYEDERQRYLTEENEYNLLFPDDDDYLDAAGGTLEAPLLDRWSEDWDDGESDPDEFPDYVGTDVGILGA